MRWLNIVKDMQFLGIKDWKTKTAGTNQKRGMVEVFKG